VRLRDTWGSLTREIPALEYTTEFVTDELKKLVGWGACPKRLPYLPHLRSLSGVDLEVSPVTMGYLIRLFLVEQIDSMTGTYQFAGNKIEAQIMNRAYKLLLMIEGEGWSAVNRRGRVIVLVKSYFSVEAWRRPIGPERDFLWILADHMVSSGIAQAA